MEVTEQWWDRHRAHRAQVMADTGQWAGLADENGVPICDLPPLLEMDAPQVRGEPGELEVAMAVRPPLGQVHTVVDELVAEGLGQQDGEGRLVPLTDPTRFVVVERPGDRRAYRVTHVEVEGGWQSPATMLTHGVSVLDMLNDHPAWSYPISITGTWHRVNQDYAVNFERERDLQDVSMAASTDGFVISGPADEAIHRLISESLAASYRAVGVTDHPIRVVPLQPAAGSPQVLIRPTDDPLWETVSATALAAGVTVTADLWWPGDTNPGLDPAPVAPTIIITVSGLEAS